jgi:transcriptional regulator with XRE-family HTH domain
VRVPTTASRTRHHREKFEFQRVALVLARAVRAARRERQWTIEEAAERFGVEPAYVRSIERGRTNPSLAVIVSVAVALDVSPADLLSEPPPTSRVRP